jgi:cytochrome b6-f complex iron-sulfur subunit
MEAEVTPEPAPAAPVPDGPAGAGLPDAARRKFLHRVYNMTLGFWVLAGMAGTGYVAGRYVWPTKEGESTGGERKVTFPVAQLADADMVKVLVEGHPVGVFRAADGVHALSIVCTHLGCLVAWNKDVGLMICPCHGSRYDPSGQVVQGPAPLPLKSYDVRVTGDTVVVG